MNAKGRLRFVFGTLAALTVAGGLYGGLPLSVQELGSELAAKPKAVRACIRNQLSEAVTEQPVSRFSLRRIENNCSKT
jgi:hypothetical protein